MPGPLRFTPPPYAAVADLLDATDLSDLHLVTASLARPPGDLPLQRLEADVGVDDVVADGDDTAPCGREPLGHRVTRRFFALCEHPRTRDRTMRLLQRSADSAVGGRLLVAFLSRMVFGPLVRSRRIDHTTARIELACAQLGGVAVLRYVTRMEPVASMPLEDLVVMVGPAVEASLTSPYRAEARSVDPS